MMPRLRPWVLLLGLAPGLALATPNFPAALQAELGLATPPDCSLCHQGEQRRGTVVTPFGTSMRAHDLVLYDEASLRAALAALDREQVDSDGDGIPDIAELKAGEDPNRGVLKPGEIELVDPYYGCSSASGGAGAGTLLLLLAWVRRRRPARSG